MTLYTLVYNPKLMFNGKTKFMLDNLYLVGHCHLRDDKRTFRLDRMKGLKISKWKIGKES
jgi:hypothetical protein